MLPAYHHEVESEHTNQSQQNAVSDLTGHPVYHIQTKCGLGTAAADYCAAAASGIVCRFPSVRSQTLKRKMVQSSVTPPYCRRSSRAGQWKQSQRDRQADRQSFFFHHTGIWLKCSTEPASPFGSLFSSAKTCYSSVQ